ncbi:hypothetical protein MVR12_005713 [Escherichia coli]|jgi:hypothetical protein|uniref:Uncharacterized protein n=2 Tax=Hafnia alvei TaxID=569 RepID=A0A377PMX8_HAFAL|nr:MULTISPECIES: hypothetical protein [Hafniaceae]EJA4670684.1 hypothetical protein [Escherichia coli]MDU1193087.1 hypothetical protein [Enterobacteriaceae bacterium]KFC86051.1 hypothetical protein GHAL_3737 [Hafnia alvei ATCC 13337]KKI41900.1 hypothetical protein XK86_18955 [Hafnia alvei]MCE9879565.1 hypothetical protein [Hafnia paralvei]
MSAVTVDLLIKELSARVDELEANNTALKHAFTATFSCLPAEVTQQTREILREWYELSVKGAPASVVDSFDKSLKEIETVVGSLK